MASQPPILAGRPSFGLNFPLPFTIPAKLWPQFSSTFHHPPHLDPLMLKPLTKSIKSKANFFHLFQSSSYFFLKILDFIT
jgi:hypothetical protein